MSEKTYELATLHDLLKVPADRLEFCLRDLQLALAVHVLAFGEAAEGVKFGPMTWIDDGKHDVDLSANGKPLLSLKTTKAA